MHIEKQKDKIARYAIVTLDGEAVPDNEWSVADDGDGKKDKGWVLLRNGDQPKGTVSILPREDVTLLFNREVARMQPVPPTETGTPKMTDGPVAEAIPVAGPADLPVSEGVPAAPEPAPVPDHPVFRPAPTASDPIPPPLADFIAAATPDPEPAPKPEAKKPETHSHTGKASSAKPSRR